jgi:hypothetical protein
MNTNTNNYEFAGLPTLSHAVRTSLQIMVPVIVDMENERITCDTENGLLWGGEIVPMSLRTLKRFCGWIEILGGWRLSDTDTDDTDNDAATWMDVEDVTSADVKEMVALRPPKAKRTDDEERSDGLPMLVGQMTRDPSGVGVIFKPYTDVIKSLREWHKPVIAVPWDVRLLDALGCYLSLDTTRSSLGGSLKSPFKKDSDPDKLCRRIERVITDAADEEDERIRQDDIADASERMLRKVKRAYNASLNAHTLVGWVAYLAQLEGTKRFPLFANGLRKHLENQGAIQTDVKATA